LGLLAACGRETQAPLSFVLISLDTTRPDHLSAYGYERETSPNFDQLAAGGALFNNAYAQWTATGPSHASMLTGLYPPTHGFGITRPRLRRRFISLSTILGNQGFRTGAFVSGFPMRGRLGHGLKRGFEVYDGEFVGTRRAGALTAAAALDWLDEERGRPFFLFLHLYDAHAPYTALGEYPRVFNSEDRGAELERVPHSQIVRDADGVPYRHVNDYIDLYDSGLVYQDNVLGTFLDGLDLERTIVIVTADHGEAMGEYQGPINLTHSSAVVDAQTRIPFLLHAPGVGPGRFDEIIETVDILPTVLELLDIDLPEGLEPAGESLVELLRGERNQSQGGLAFTGTWSKLKQAVAGRWIFSAAEPLELDRQRVVFAARSMRWKLVVFPGMEGDWVALYDMDNDPLETTDVGDQYPEIRERLLERSTLWLTGAEEEIEELEMTPDEIEKMRALGYVD
jgi:arylsulfatase A-like enzyme